MGSAPSLAFLVAFRDTDGTRTPLWDFIRERTARLFPGAEIVVASDDGVDPFHKTAALNRAAAMATADTFVVWDADTWVEPEHVHEVVDTGRWGRAWGVKVKLNAEATAHVMALGTAWDGIVDHRPFGRPENANTYWAGPPIVVPRAMWDAVGGMDERFRGWGSEDEAFGCALRTMFGQPARSRRGMAYHLHHPRIGRSGGDLWVGQESSRANHELARRYKRATTPAALRVLIDERMVRA